MCEYRSMGHVIVVDDGRSSRGAMQALNHKLEGLVQDGTIPTFQVIQEDEMLKQNAALAAVLASSPPSFLDMYREAPKRPKEEAPREVQLGRMSAAESKRRRKKLKRLRDLERQEK